MKALVLAGGRGTRLRPITHTGAKQLVPVANKPVLFYGLEAIRGAGITDVGIVVSDPLELLKPDHRTGEMNTVLVNSQAEIRSAVGDGAAFGLRVTYIQQEAPLGLAHAVKISESYMAGEPFVMYLGDNLIRDGITPFVREFEAGKPNAQILLAKVATPQDYGVAELSGDRVVRLEEKPKQPKSDLALVGVYLFDRSVFDAVRAIQQLIDSGRRVRSHVITGWWKDTGKLEDMLEANRIVLSDQSAAIEGTVSADTVVEGAVRVGAGSVIERSRLRGPLIIGPRVTVRDAYVGPFTSIGAGCHVERCEIEHSIVLERSRLHNIQGRVESSLIGKDVVVCASGARPRTHQLVLGDSSRVELA